MTDDIEPADGQAPARGYVWPPFTEGNTAALSHGAWSPRQLAPLVATTLAWIEAQAARADSPVAYLADATYRPALVRWATLEAKCERLRVWLDDLETEDRPGDIDENGEVRPAAELLRRWETQAAKVAERLGLDPLSRSKLGAQLATTRANLAAVDAAGAQALAGRAPVPATDPIDTTTQEPPP